MIRRYRWLLVGSAVGAFAVGFVLSLSTFAPAPAAPEANGSTANAPTMEKPTCDDFSGRFIGVHDGHVAVFEGEPGGCHRLVETHSISIRELPTFQVLDLERGIAFSGDEELFQILEGLTVP